MFDSLSSSSCPENYMVVIEHRHPNLFSADEGIVLRKNRLEVSVVFFFGSSKDGKQNAPTFHGEISNSWWLCRGAQL